MSKKGTTPTKQTGKNILIKLGVIVTFIFILFTSVTHAATYPTAEHRRIAAEIETANQKMFSGQGTDSDEMLVSSLAATPENQHTTNLMLVNMTAFFVLFIAVTGYLYRHIRSKRLARNPLYATTNIMVVSGAIMTLYTLVLDVIFVRLPMPGTFETIMVIAVSTLFTLVFALLISSIFKNIYDRKHSFEID